MCIGSSQTPAIGSAAPTSTLLGAASIGAPQGGPIASPGARLNGVGTRGTILGGGGAGTHNVGLPSRPGRANSL